MRRARNSCSENGDRAHANGESSSWTHVRKTDRWKRAWVAGMAAALLGASAARAQQSGAPGVGGSAPSPEPMTVQQAAAAASAEENPLFGGVPSEKATAGVLPLSILDAVHRALQHNLALLLSDDATAEARAARWQSLSHLLPHVTAGASENIEQINLQSFGFPGFKGIPQIVGPFSVFDVRGYVSQPIFNMHSLYTERASKANLESARYSYQNARDLVVLVAVDLYLEANAGASRVEAAATEVKTAQALYDLANNQHAAGLAAKIDVLRAQVELEAEQELLIYDRNQYQTEKLDLKRAIGLAMGQKIALTTNLRNAHIPPISLEDALSLAYHDRSDYRSAQAQLRAAESAQRAARADRWPTASFDGNYGDTGIGPGVSHGTFAVGATLHVPIFQGGKVKGEVMRAQTLTRERQSQLASLRNQIAYDVRTAFFNLESTSKQVEVATSALALAHEQLREAQDRFKAGVVNSLEVVQAQQALAAADENYISSLYASNVAKASLARAVGGSEKTITQFLIGMAKSE